VNARSGLRSRQALFAFGQVEAGLVGGGILEQNIRLEGHPQCNAVSVSPSRSYIAMKGRPFSWAISWM
jgi:hypothetical protein